MKILIVEDEKKISDLTRAFLEKEGYTVYQSFDGKDGLDKFKQLDIDLIILDLMIPKISGEELCSRIRSSSNIPIIMVTAKVEESEKIEGLAIGADDYITKPFSNRELVQRVKALIRRSYGDNPRATRYSFEDGNLKIDIEKGVAKRGEEEIELTGSEIRILKIFLSNMGAILDRETLIEKALGMDYSGSDRTIDAHIKNIRQKIELDPKRPKYIVTVYGMGYRFGETV